MSFVRSAALLGAEAMERIKSAHVAVVGIGGVGSWCAEALVRTGVGRLTLIDDDVIQPSNLNRQCPATTKTIGLAKVETMRERLLEINPLADITAVNKRFALGMPLPDDVSLIIDAIDSVDCKAELILSATAAGAPIISSMGAAWRLDPTKVTVKRFDRVEGDGLARALRQHFKKLARFPSSKFFCVCSTELPQESRHPPSKSLESPKPSYMPVTCAFGMALAAAAIRSLTDIPSGQ